jgi:hypothetical protein
MLTKFRDLEALIEAGDKEAALQKLAELEVVVLPVETKVFLDGRWQRIGPTDLSPWLCPTEAHDPSGSEVDG